MASNTSWLDTTNWRTVIASILEYFLTYDAEKRKVVVAEAPRRLGQILGVVVSVALFVFLLRRIRRKWRTLGSDGGLRDAVAVLPWYRELVRILDRGGISPRLGQTPKEYAERAAAELRVRCAEVAEIPAFVTSKLYRMRFAGVPLTADELTAVQSALIELERQMHIAKA